MTYPQFLIQALRRRRMPRRQGHNGRAWAIMLSNYLQWPEKLGKT